jgi:hypothetical protein
MQAAPTDLTASVASQAKRTSSTNEFVDIVKHILN